MTHDHEALQALSEKATKGPWVADTERSDGSYGSGEDTSEGYDTAVILTEAEAHYGKPGVLFESHNSTVGLIHEESNEDDFRAWDAVSEANAEFIVALVNAYRSGDLIHRSKISEETARAGEAMRERCADTATRQAAWYPYWDGQAIHFAVAAAIRALPLTEEAGHAER